MTFIRQYTDASYPVFQKEECVEDAVKLLLHSRLYAAPVLDGKQFLAMASLHELQAGLNEAEDSSSLKVSHLHFRSSVVLDIREHLLDSISRIADDTLPVIAVTGDDGGYEGVVLRDELFRDVASVFNLLGDEFTLELEVPSMGVKISEIVQSIEKNDAMVLSFGARAPEPDAAGMVITFRVHTSSLYRLVKNLEKYGYLIGYHSPYSGEGRDELRDKALEFMRYIDM
ncbi:putative signal transduction protein with CBS domains [Prosthecochloris aestuarii DSM 271]|uniref:Signal transduction protein with CBS domains n=1 Tax=Prosthecochloris aestuarii (strain DSM 271 / SK 413) TaxID=290512 RepID=B4S7P5_PROA2|nr:CBS domain-containing protein [Prosthecochloris aestuarii]ACF46082.1 putative signal transduction protein with CBS domains [Prosthecochloris aestuarii DSM 271]